MKSGSWSSYQAALPPEARGGGEPDDLEPTANEVILDCVSDFCGDLGHMLTSNGRGLTWRAESREWLFMRLRQEVEELAHAMGHGTRQQQDKECLDIAAFAMMIVDQGKHAP